MPSARRLVSSEAALAAAHQVFDDKGLQQAHMAEIAHSAGMAKAHLYNLFRNKDQLFLAVYRRAVLRALPVRLRLLRRARHRPARLGHLSATLLALADGHSVYRLPMDLCERALHDAELRSELDEVQAEIGEAVRRGLVEAGLLSGVRPQAEHSTVRLLSCLPSLLPLAATSAAGADLTPVLTTLLEGLFEACD